MDLFLDDPKGLPKLAQAFTRLSENPDDWQAEIINELYRQAPYAGDFDPTVVMNELDPERRYAMGSIELASKTAVNPRDERAMPESQGVKRVLIPIIVKDGKLYPLDVFIHNGKSQPMTEERLRRAMFRPELFEAAGQRPGDQDIMGMLYPPYRSGGFGLGGNARVGSIDTGAGVAKVSSARCVLDAIHGTIKEADVKRVEEALNADPTLQAAFISNKATLGFMAKLAQPRPQLDGRGMLKVAFQQIPPKVIQLSHRSGKFLIKTANPQMLFPEENEVDRPEAMQVVGEDLVRQAERDGTVTVSTDAVIKDSLADARLKTVDEFGEWKVRTADGRELVGWAFPRVVDLDGTNQALAVFSNGSEAAVQENIAGSLVGKGANVIDEAPRGFGCFYLSRQGGATALIPMDILTRFEGPEGEKGFLATTMLGESITLRLVPGLNKVSEINENTYGIPEDCGFMPLRELVPLAENPDAFAKTAEAQAIMRDRVEVMYEQGGTYSMRGSSTEKLAQVLPIRFINKDQAVYDLAVLGVTPTHAKEKLAEAHKLSRWVPIDGTRPVTLASEVYHQAKLAAAKRLERLPQIKSLLLKEAAALDDPLSVDRVLSIGFLNPENIGTFIAYLPEFEDTLKKLSELLVASRLGLSSVDAGALERVVKHLDKVIGGLRELAQHPTA